jgi:hypothetical protein
VAGPEQNSSFITRFRHTGVRSERSQQKINSTCFVEQTFHAEFKFITQRVKAAAAPDALRASG